MRGPAHHQPTKKFVFLFPFSPFPNQSPAIRRAAVPPVLLHGYPICSAPIPAGFGAVPLQPLDADGSRTAGAESLFGALPATGPPLDLDGALVAALVVVYV